MNHIDHRLLISQYDLGHIEEHSPGLIHWHPNGQRVLRRLREYVLRLHEKHLYEEVSSPIILHRSLWERSGHWEKYQDNMFVIPDQDYAVKPMSCPGHIAIYQNARRSYRDLPMRLFEFGHVHRNEPSGALSGWMRLRGFVQDDSHVFAAPHQIDLVIKDVVQMIEQAYKDFGFEKWSWRLSLRPERRAGSDELWDQAEQALRQCCQQLGVEVIEAPGEGAFYGPKLEASLHDRLGRVWQCGVAQLDFVLPERFGLEYQDAQGHHVMPVMVHHAILGSLERWLSIVMENFGELPAWLVPHPVAVCPLSQDHEPYAQELVDLLRRQGVLAHMCADGPLGGRLRQLDNEGVLYRVVVGKREQELQNVSLRFKHDPVQVLDVEQMVVQLSNALAPPCL